MGTRIDRVARVCFGHVVLAMVAIALVLGAPTSISGFQDQVSPDSDPSGMEIGPIEGLTTTWHPGPETTSIPVGTKLSLRVSAPRAATVTWTGAVEIGRDDAWSVAACDLNTVGRTLVSVTVTAGVSVEVHECLLDVVDVAIEDIDVSPILVHLDPIEIDETLPPDELNQITMDYYFGDSIAAIQDLGDGLYRTSVDRLVPLEVIVEPRGFGPLIEWRVNGAATALGAVIEHDIDRPGFAFVSAGPPASEQEIEIETYAVFITG